MVGGLSSLRRVILLKCFVSIAYPIEYSCFELLVSYLALRGYVASLYKLYFFMLQVCQTTSIKLRAFRIGDL